MIEIVIDESIIEESNVLISQPLPSTINDLWQHFRELSCCLWKIRTSINDFIDSLFPPKRTGFSLSRNDYRFDDSALLALEDRIQQKMDECSKEAKRLTLERQNIYLKMLKENKNVEE